ncbi:MAG: 50S ribosomal protein L29 [Sphingopyxis sp.]
MAARKKAAKPTQAKAAKAGRAKAGAKARKATSAPKPAVQSEALAKLRAKSPAELTDELMKLRKEQFALRLQRATGQAVKPDQFGKVRKNIARLKTIAREAELASAAGVKK